MRHAILTAAVTGLSLAALLMINPQARATNVVLCYDVKRDLIQKVDDFDCDHKIVTQQQADEIRAKRNAYVRRALEIERRPAPFGTGSGFFVSRYGHVITNRHVVANCGRITALTPGGKTLKAHLVSASSKYDLALLRTDTTPVRFATITTDVPRVGAPVNVVGYPARLRPRRSPMITSGRYRGVRTGASGTKVLSVAVRVSGGSSGSPVLDDDGQVIGVIFAKLDTRHPDYREGVAPAGAAQDIALATSAPNLKSFLTVNGIRVRATSDEAIRGEDIAVRVNCLES